MKKILQTMVKNALFLIMMNLVVFVNAGSANRKISPGYTETQEIFQSFTLTKEQKLQKLESFLDKYPQRIAYLLIELDRGAAHEIILKHFRDTKISKIQKLELGRTLLQNLDARDIVPEFKEFLATDIVQNIDEFMRPQDDYAASGPAEYVYIASEFSGYHDPKLFDAFKDERTIPNLIKALNAPDWIWPKEQGDNIRGTPGTPTGRNVARQLIPIALAKLNAKIAIPNLMDKFQKHHDEYLRINSAYALGYLLGKDEKEDFEKQLSREKNQNLVFEFAKGSIAAGDYSALKYIFVEKYPQGAQWSSILYDLEQRLSVLTGVKDPRTKIFYSALISNEPFRQLVMADFENIPVSEREWQMGFKSKEDYLHQQMHRIVKIYDQLVQSVQLNNFNDLWDDVLTLGYNSSSSDIQTIAKAFCVRSACQ